MSKIEVNTVAPQCGTTLTLGESGDTVTLGTGASQSGFGRTGTVDWQTGSIKTTTFTAANGEGYFADTSSGAFTMNLPAGTAGAIVSVADYTNTFQTNALTVAPNGSQKIGGIAASNTLSTEGQSITLVYVDDTEGWKNVQDSTSNVTGNPFLIASGGTESECGNCKIHTFTGPGNFVVSAVAACAAQNIMSHLIIAGGASGGSNLGDGSGGGGAGGFREVKNPVTPYTASPLDGYGTPANRVTVTAQSYPIVVGGGGAGVSGNPNTTSGTTGSNSSFGGITSAGGGGGAATTPTPGSAGANGGSGGGSGGGSSGIAGGVGNTPPVSPPQGNNGGSGGGTSPDRGAGGGGGAGAAGTSSPNSTTAGSGGNGVATSITGSSVTRAGGGGANIYHPGATSPGPAGSGGATAGGGNGGSSNATANTGSGSGGAANAPPSSGNGGSGIVVIRYKFK